MDNVTTVKYDEESDEYYFDIEDILKGTSVKKEDVDKYDLKYNETKQQFELKLYDKDGNQIKLDK